MATIAELQDALVNADKAGDKEAARKLADAIVAARGVEDAKPASVQAGSALRDAGRQVGLTARYGLEALAGIGDIVHEPIRALVNIGSGDNPRAPRSLSQMVSGTLDAAGFPSPQGANERVIGDAARTGFGSVGMAGLAGKASRVVNNPTARNVLQSLSQAPGTQAVSGATAGAAGGAVREAGGGPVEQFAASLLGGVTGGLGSTLAQRGASSLANALTPTTVKLQQADQQIRLVLERQGIDWSQVPERVRQSMRQEAANALATGEGLNGDALRRLLVMQRAGIERPTVGQLTQDPGLITRERNLAKTGANSTNQSLQALSSQENANVQRLLRNLDELGAARARDEMATGSSAINALEGVVNRNRGEINALYSQARDSSGRSLPLDPHAFTSRANALLDENMLGGALPQGVANTMNKVATGEIPLTVEIAEQIKTQLGKLQRASSDGQARMALGLVRQALDDAPLIGSQRVNPGNLAAAPGAVPPSTQAGTDAINAFNLARSANRQFMNRVESSPALQAVVNGVEPDKFVNRYIISSQASAGDVRMLRADLPPDVVQSVRDYLVKHLRDAATNSTDDIAKFSNSAYRAELRKIGDAKLAEFFSPEEIQMLKDTGNAAKYLQAQPAGSAVNNSNSGALMLGRGLDMLDAAAQRLPLGFRDVLSGTIQGQQQRQVMTPANALRIAPPRGPVLPPNALLLGAVTSVANGRDDDPRNKRP